MTFKTYMRASACLAVMALSSQVLATDASVATLDTRMNWHSVDDYRLSADFDNLTNLQAWAFHPYPQRTLLVDAGWRL